MKSTAEVIVAASAAGASAPGSEVHAFASVVPIVGPDGVVLKRFRVLPFGEFTLRDGRGPFKLVDRTHADQVAAATRAYAGAQDLPIDYDHQTHFAAIPGVGGTAKAAGWVKTVEVQGDGSAEDDGIYFNVDWTPPAEAALAAKEWRYVSPLFGHTADGRVTRLFNAGLTNTPAIDDLGAIAASQEQPQGKSMDLKALAALYGLPETATITEILAAASAAQTAATKAGEDLTTANAALGQLRTALGASATATTAELIAAASAQKPDPSAFAPMSVVTTLQSQVAALTTKNITEIVAAATAAGKIAPAPEQQAWALDYATKDLAGFERYVAAATAIVTPGPKPKSGLDPAAGVDSLTEEDRVAASIAGVTLEDYLATKKELAQ